MSLVNVTVNCDTILHTFSHEYLSADSPGPDTILYDPPHDSMWEDKTVENKRPPL